MNPNRMEHHTFPFIFDSTKKNLNSIFLSLLGTATIKTPSPWTHRKLNVFTRAWTHRKRFFVCTREIRSTASSWIHTQIRASPVFPWFPKGFWDSSKQECTLWNGGLLSPLSSSYGSHRMSRIVLLYFLSYIGFLFLFFLFFFIFSISLFFPAVQRVMLVIRNV